MGKGRPLPLQTKTMGAPQAHRRGLGTSLSPPQMGCPPTLNPKRPRCRIHGLTLVPGKPGSDWKSISSASGTSIEPEFGGRDHASSILVKLSDPGAMTLSIG